MELILYADGSFMGRRDLLETLGDIAAMNSRILADTMAPSLKV